MRIASVLLFLFVPLFGQQSPPASNPTDLNKRDLKIEKDAPPPKEPESVTIPRSYALVVGVASYPKLAEKFQLHYTERDAESIYSVLISPEGGNFHAENVHKLIGAKATLANLRHELEEWLPSVAKDDDRVLIYFAGHGFLNNGRAFLLPTDVDANNVEATAYPMESLASVIGGKIHAKTKILMTDACHSGAIRPEDSQNLNRAVVDLQKSLFSLTASRDRELSFESEKWGGGHGIFTYYVVRGMEGEADQNQDGIVTADELQDYVYRNVREASDGRQNPTSDQGSFDSQMLISYVPSRAKPAPPVQSKFGTFVIEVNMDGVEVFLDDVSVGVVNKDKPLILKGLTPSSHRIKGVKNGYEPDGPRDETVYPGQQTTVSIKILIPRHRTRAAVEALDKGLAFYSKGYAQNYQKAVEEFAKALELDPAYSQAALYLGRAYNALFDEANAEKYFRRAIAIDPDYLDAHSSFGGMLLDIGNTDEAIRQFTTVLNHEPDNAFALTNLSECYRMKGLYPDSIEAAQKAIKRAPQYAEPHLWLAESLRLSGKFDASKTEYNNYLQLSNFQSGVGGQLNYFVMGYLVGMGKRKRAAQQDIWKDMHSTAYFGLCDCERKLGSLNKAIINCQKALTFDPSDAYTHYALALSFAKQGSQIGSYEMLAAALMHFESMLKINPDLQEAGFAKQNIMTIEKSLASR
jgi:tetratricopeptide (TPR) repeat protein